LGTVVGFWKLSRAPQSAMRFPQIPFTSRTGNQKGFGD